MWPSERHGDPSAVGHGRRACDQSRSRVRASPARPDRVDHVHRHLTGLRQRLLGRLVHGVAPRLHHVPSHHRHRAVSGLQLPTPCPTTRRVPSSRSTGPPTRSCSSTGYRHRHARPPVRAKPGDDRPGDHNHHRPGQPQWCGHPGDRPRLGEEGRLRREGHQHEAGQPGRPAHLPVPPGAGVVFYIILAGATHGLAVPSAGRSAPSPASPPSRWTPPRPCGRSSSASRSERAQETSPAVVTFSPSAARER